MWLSLIRFRLAAWQYDVYAVNSILNMFVKLSAGVLQDRGIPAARKKEYDYTLLWSNNSKWK